VPVGGWNRTSLSLSLKILLVGARVKKWLIPEMGGASEKEVWSFTEGTWSVQIAPFAIGCGCCCWLVPPTNQPTVVIVINIKAKDYHCLNLLMIAYSCNRKGNIVKCTGPDGAT